MERTKKDIRDNRKTVDELRNNRREEKLRQEREAKFRRLLEKRLFSEPSVDVKKHRAEELEEWRQQKQKEREIEKKNRKVAFKYYNVNTKSVPIFQFELKKNDDLKNCFAFCSKLPMKEIQNDLNLRRSERIKQRNDKKTHEISDISKKKDKIINAEKCRNANDFYQLLDLNYNQLDELCNTWSRLMKIKKFEQFKIDNIDSVIGQTKLLLSKKFKKFRNLIQTYEKCIHKTNSRKLMVNINDLRGFWYEVEIQIKRLKVSFERLHNNDDREIIYSQSSNSVKSKTPLSVKKLIPKCVMNVITETPKRRSSFGMISCRLSLMSRLVDTINSDTKKDDFERKISISEEIEISNQSIRL